MLRIDRYADRQPSKAEAEKLRKLVLAYELRQKSRLRVSLSDGTDAALESTTGTKNRATRIVRTDIPKMTPVRTSIHKLLRLLHPASSALPIGGFSYSQGLESAAEMGLVHDHKSAQAWIQSGLEVALGANELPMLAALYRAWQQENYQEVRLKNAWFLVRKRG